MKYKKALELVFRHPTLREHFMVFGDSPKNLFRFLTNRNYIWNGNTWKRR